MGNTEASLSLSEGMNAAAPDGALPRRINDWLFLENR
jgi:hypothetical protein